MSYVYNPSYFFHSQTNACRNIQSFRIVESVRDLGDLQHFQQFNFMPCFLTMDTSQIHDRLPNNKQAVTP